MWHEIVSVCLGDSDRLFIILYYIIYTVILYHIIVILYYIGYACSALWCRKEATAPTSRPGSTLTACQQIIIIVSSNNNHNNTF